MSTRKSHKAKRQWKSPSERVKPETQAETQPATSSAQTTDAALGALVPSTLSKNVPDKPSETGDSDPRSVVMLPPPIEKKPYWYRPPDSKARKHFEKIAVYRTAGHDDAEIAKRMYTTEQSVRQYVYLAKMNGWADNDGEPVDLEAQMAMDVDRKLVRNLDRALDGGFTNYQTHEVTMMLAKQRKVVTNIDQGGQGVVMPGVVAIQVVMPPVGAGDQQIIEANVGGVPAFQEGEVINGLESGQAGDGAYQAPAAAIQH